MERNININFEGETASSMKKMVEYFEKMNLSLEEIVSYISGVDDLTKSGMHLFALANGNQVLADRIERAIEIIRKRRLEDFESSVKNGTYEEFLSTMSLEDKSSLMVSLYFLKNEIGGNDLEYTKILRASMENDVEKEALEQGFSSSKEWREYNRRMVNANRRAMEETNRSFRFQVGNAMSKVLKRIKRKN